MPLAPLPIDAVLPELLAALRASPSVVLRAPTGAGKTTRVPPAILDAGLAGEGQIVVLQPRRIAARATAQRMAQERNGRLGQEIGYQVRFENVTGPRTRIRVVTEGVLLRQLVGEPFLERVGAVVFDEFHERNLASDLALGMVRRVQQSVRPELKIVVMSATLAVEPIAAYLGGCPGVESTGRSFPVEIVYSPDDDVRQIESRAAAGVREVASRTPGDILVFLPGVREIHQTQRLLSDDAAANDWSVLPLYGDLTPAQQDAALQPQSRRKIILATNVAETSLTVEGVTGVVDSGLARASRFDPRLGLDRLELGPVSKASTDQRAGRAGRTAPGVCLRLWTRTAHARRPDFELPEVRRVDLSGAVLQLANWIEPDARRFPWFESPSEESIEQAETLLRRLGALDERGVTPLGQTLARLPVQPRLARLAVEGHKLGVLRDASIAAAMLTERDFVRRDRLRAANQRLAAADSDLVERLDLVEAFAERPASPPPEVEPGAARNVLRVAEALEKTVLSECGPEPATQVNRHEGLARALLAAFPDRLARRREQDAQRGLMVGGRGVLLASESRVREAELFLCIDVDRGQEEALVRQASAVRRDWLPSEQLTSSIEVVFDDSLAKVVARKRTRWHGLLLSDTPAAVPDNPRETSAVLARAAAERLDSVLPGADHPASVFITRVENLRGWMPELQLPALDRAAFVELLPDLCWNRRSLADLRSAPWLTALQGRFTYPQLQTIDREAPERLQVPSGSWHSLQYEVNRPPVLAVRIQEMFGLADTPRVAAGRVPVLLHLLAPNHRPQQVTDDLRSFWNQGYSIVRKELRARYPKHSWPEDPWNAPPESRPKRRS